MLDVHAPEHPIHGIREFLIHLFTITVGLLIALGLENLAEWRHHVHLRNEADANIMSEIRDNRKELGEIVERVPDELSNLRRILAFIDARTSGKPTDIKNMNLGLTMGSPQDASWQTANSTGALSYMEYSHVKRYSAAYTVQNEFVQLQAQTLSAYLQTQSYIAGNDDPTKLSLETLGRARTDVQRAMADLVAMQQIGTAALHEYDEALKP